MKDKVIELLAEYTGYADPITEDTTLVDDLGLSSLDLAELAGIIEDRFAILLPDDEMVNLRTIGDVFNLIQKTL